MRAALLAMLVATAAVAIAACTRALTLPWGGDAVDPDAPATVRAVSTLDSVTLSWSAVAGATQYRVAGVGTDGAGSLSAVVTTTSARFSAIAMKTWRFSVFATLAGDETGPTLTVSGGDADGEFGYALDWSNVDGDAYDDIAVGDPWRHSRLGSILHERLARRSHPCVE